VYHLAPSFAAAKRIMNSGVQRRMAGDARACMQYTLETNGTWVRGRPQSLADPRSAANRQQSRDDRKPSPMYSITNLIFALILGGGIGGAIGWYWALSSRGDNKRRLIMELESQLDQARQSRADYEAEVSEHFSQTADLLHKLTDDYRAVYTHLAEGAEQLCGDQVSISKAALSAPDASLSDKPHLVEVAQPLDYAPKKPDEQGQLSETFGLDKSNTSAA